MAKLEAYYGLCPLIDTNSLLGVSEDAESGIVIVTLGQNIAIKYKVVDQKQICSWRTKEKFCTPVLYDRLLSKYVAAFNQSHIKLWNKEDENLDKLKKIKFNKQIQGMVQCNGESIIIFKNGGYCKLHELLDIRNILEPDMTINDGEIEEILSITWNRYIYLGFLMKSTHYYLYWSNSIDHKFRKMILTRPDSTLAGSMLYPQQNGCNLLTIWSDGKMFLHALTSSTTTTATGENSTWELFAVVEEISTKKKVSMVYLDENYIALYGASNNEEGATLLLYNAQFKIVQSKQLFKMFTNDSKLWSINNNIYIAIGQHLAVIPFRLEIEKLAFLLGNHKMCSLQNSFVCPQVETTLWENNEIVKSCIPDGLNSKINHIIKEGTSEFNMIENILPNITKNSDIPLFAEFINNFSQIPEKYIAKILKFLINSSPNIYNTDNTITYDNFPSSLQPSQRISLINTVLSKPYNSITLQAYLYTYLSISDIVAFLKYISLLLSENCNILQISHTLPEETLLGWVCLFVELVFQKCLLSEQENLLLVLEQLSSILKNVFHFHVNCIPININYYKHQGVLDSSSLDLGYCVDQLCLY